MNRPLDALSIRASGRSVTEHRRWSDADIHLAHQLHAPGSHDDQGGPGPSRPAGKPSRRLVLGCETSISRWAITTWLRSVTHRTTQPRQKRRSRSRRWATSEPRHCAPSQKRNTERSWARCRSSGGRRRRVDGRMVARCRRVGGRAATSCATSPAALAPTVGRPTSGRMLPGIRARPNVRPKRCVVSAVQGAAPSFVLLPPAIPTFFFAWERDDVRVAGSGLPRAAPG